MKKNILCFLTGVVITIVAGLIFVNYGKEGETTNNQVLPENAKKQVSFENKEKCMKYFDKYRDYLKETYESDMDDLKIYLGEYEMFYNSELDTCICAYSMDGHMKDSNGKSRPSYYFKIVDYLNGEKELFNCWEDTYFEHLGGNEVGKKGAECQREFWKEKDKYKN